MADDTGDPAFGHGNPEHGGDPGMSLLDYFAGQALIGLLSNEDAISEIQKAAREEGVTYPEYTATIAYNVADAMLNERRTGKQGEAE